MTDREHIQTLLTVARRYWLEQATQAEIAAEIDARRARSEKAQAAIRAEILAKYGRTE